MTDHELKDMRSILEELIPMRGMGWKVAYLLLSCITAVIMAVATWTLIATIQAQADIVTLQTKVIALSVPIEIPPKWFLSRVEKLESLLEQNRGLISQAIARPEYDRGVAAMVENMRLNNVAHERIVEKLDRISERNWNVDSARGGPQVNRGDLNAK